LKVKTYIAIAEIVFLFVTGAVTFGKPRQDPYDSYRDISWELEKAHLDNFALFLQHEQDMIGYIIVYAGRRVCVGEAKERALRAARYVVKTRGIQQNRVKWIDGGYREELTVVLQPAAIGLPPPVFPTVESNEVRVIRNCKRKISKRRRHGS
jgi:hypothetical protein